MSARLPPGRDDRDREDEGAPRRSAVDRSLRHFAVWSLALLLVVATGTALMVARAAREEVLRDAGRLGTGLGHGIVEPLLTPAFLAREPGAVAALDAVLRNRIRDGSLTRIKIWDERGTVLWSDEARLVGRAFELAPDQTEPLRTGGVLTRVSRLDDEDNLHEAAAAASLIEVYVGLRAAGGEPVLFELYSTTAALTDDTRSLIGSLLPVAIGGLLLFQVGITPLSVSLARTVDRARVERERLLADAAAAGDLERRRVAHDLHDGVIQDLAGLGYLLSSASRRDDRDRRPADEVFVVAESIVQRDVASLRALLTDLYPPDLAGAGLACAVHTLVHRAERSGVTVTPVVDDVGPLPEPVATVAYRVVREGLRNVVRHSGAARARVELGWGRTGLRVRISDDGCGMVLDEGPEREVAGGEGHFGLRLLRDAVRDLGGDLVVESPASGGTVLTADLPLGDDGTGREPRRRADRLWTVRRGVGHGARSPDESEARAVPVG